MPDYEPPPITGYRPLTASQVDAMNIVKLNGKHVGEVLDMLEEQFGSELDKRWLSIARTHLQEGFMFACRAIANPEGF